MDPWLSPIRTFPAEAHIVVTSGFCGGQSTWAARVGVYVYYGSFLGVTLSLCEGRRLEEAELSPLKLSG